MKALWFEDGGRILLGDNAIRRGGNATADQVPVGQVMDLSRTPLYIHTYIR